MSYENYEDMPMFLTVKEISDLLGLSTAGVYNLANNDKTFPVVVCGRRKVIPRDGFREWVTKHTRH